MIINNCSVMEVTSITDPNNTLKCSKMSLPNDNEQDFYSSYQPNVSKSLIK